MRPYIRVQLVRCQALEFFQDAPRNDFGYCSPNPVEIPKEEIIRLAVVGCLTIFRLGGMFGLP